MTIIRIFFIQWESTLGDKQVYVEIKKYINTSIDLGVKEFSFG